jgi:tetratricopeptide (TPR) repeat protein
LEEDTEQGGHARRVMVSYETWLGDGPELAILRLLGLYDRPADSLVGLDQRRWSRALARLRQARLLAEADPIDPDTLDAHPMVREHFGQQLQDEYPEAWRQGNNRLYEYFKGAAPEYPDTLAEMAPLFAAVAHGCAAGRHQEALEEVYWGRISRRNDFYSTTKLGAFGADLAALSGFFDPSWRRPVAGLSENHQGYVSNVAGFCLRALGRLAEAAQPLQASLETATARNNLQNAAIAVSNLSELYLTLGDIAAAVETAQQSVELADRSGDAFTRMANRTVLADALHQAGRLEEAAAAFAAAEAMQKKRQPAYPLLYSVQGFEYCDLLLSQGLHETVLARAAQTLEWMTNDPNTPVLTIALEHLSLGRAHLMAAQANGRSDFSQATYHLDRAVDGLRQAGTQDYLPRGLLARAALHRHTGAFERAQRDLEEARSIAERGGMRLYLADVQLESARLALAQGHQAEARQSLATAREIIREMGYHRRDSEVAELEAAL